MTKLQRTTRSRLMSQEEEGVKGWVSVQDKESAIGKLLSHEGYKEGTCEKSILMLLQVSTYPLFLAPDPDPNPSLLIRRSSPRKLRLQNT